MYTSYLSIFASTAFFCHLQKNNLDRNKNEIWVWRTSSPEHTKTQNQNDKNTKLNELMVNSRSSWGIVLHCQAGACRAILHATPSHSSPSQYTNTNTNTNTNTTTNSKILSEMKVALPHKLLTLLTLLSLPSLRIMFSLFTLLKLRTLLHCIHCLHCLHCCNCFQCLHWLHCLDCLDCLHCFHW